MGTQDFEIEDESGGDYPDTLGLVGAEATYAPAGGDEHRVTIVGDEHDPKAGTWTVWIETDDGVIETTGEYIREVGT